MLVGPLAIYIHVISTFRNQSRTSYLYSFLSLIKACGRGV